MKLTRNIAVLIASLLLLGACATVTPAQREAREAAVARATKGKALFEEKCRTVAGEKIYRTVRDVDGILLLKVRPTRGERELANLMWPGAAFAREATGDEYITTFLGYEYSSLEGKPVTPQNRGYINTNRRAGGLAGYRFVDVRDDMGRYRYTAQWYEPWKEDKSYSKGYVKFSLKKALVESQPPRYAVTFQDHVISEERKLGIASSTVSVIDLKTNHVLAELTRYAWSPGAPNRANPTPWLTAYRCPDEAVGTGAATRKFVDQVLIPSRGE